MEKEKVERSEIPTEASGEKVAAVAAAVAGGGTFEGDKVERS